MDNTQTQEPCTSIDEDGNTIWWGSAEKGVLMRSSRSDSYYDNYNLRRLLVAVGDAWVGEDEEAQKRETYHLEYWVQESERGFKEPLEFSWVLKHHHWMPSSSLTTTEDPDPHVAALSEVDRRLVAEVTAQENAWHEEEVREEQAEDEENNR